MKGKQKNIMTYIACLCMIASMFPVFGVWAEGGGHGRDAHIVVTDITVQHISHDVVDGIYRNGNFRLNVSFQLTDAVKFVNVTWNVTHIDTSTSEINTTHLGNLTAGNHFSHDAHAFNFGTAGEYLINATVWGNYSSANISTSLTEQLTFSNQARYILVFEVTGGSQADTGEYGNQTLITMSGNVTNKGNNDIQHTNVTVNITGPEGVEDVETPWNNPFGLLLVNNNISNVQFNWRPSTEGDFDVNVTATDVATNQSNSTNFTVTVRDVANVHVGEIRHDTPVIAEYDFEVTVFLDNTGNVEKDVIVNLTILNESLVSVYTAEVPEEVSPLMLKTPIQFFNVSVKKAGAYTIHATAEGTQNQSALIVLPIPDTAPILEGETFVPNPYDEDVHADDIITFYVNYSDRNNDVGNVTLVLDETEYEMVLSDGVGDNWTTVETFKYEWIAEEGAHNFYFNFTDGVFDETYAPLYNDFIVLPPIMGMLYGKVTDVRTGANISGAEIVLYSTVLNETDVTKIDTYYNLTADDNGSYEKELSFSNNKYVLLVDEEWMEANKYMSPTPSISNFWMNLNNKVVWKNFTVESVIPPPPKTWLNGTVLDENLDNLSNVTITVEIFTDVLGNKTVQKEINGTLGNVSVDITTRTWMNMTANTDDNGNYSIIGVPFGMPEGINVTGTKVFRHDLGGAPRDVSEGWWYVNASKEGYESQEKMYRFKEGETTVANFNMTLPPELRPKATISGIIVPADAKITIVPAAAIVHDNTSGVFTIADLEDGNYNLTFNATGYIDRTEEVSIVDGADYKVGNITLVNWTPPDITYQVPVGPFMDGEDAVPGINVSFSLEGILYWKLSGPNGEAIFDLPVKVIPDGTEITATKNNTVKTWKWNIDIAPYTGIFEAEETDKPKGDDDPSYGGLILIILGVVAIIIVIVVILMMRSKTKEEELFEEEMREYECPGCGAIVNAGMDACPECGEAFEVEEFRCPECSEEIEKDATMCDSCGAEFEMPEKVEEGEEEEEEVPDEPEAIEDFDVEDEDEEIEGVEEAAEELEEEIPPPMEEEELDDLDDELEDLDDDLNLEDL